MTVYIDNQSFEIQPYTYMDVEKIWFGLPLSFSEAVALGDSPSIRVEDSGFSEEYTVTSMKSVEATDVGTVVTWLFDTVEHQLEKRLEETQAELTEKSGEIDSIKEAIKNLSGVPTLTKLTAFLAAIKEIIHYE